MRCSICLSEMKQGPNGLECVACGTLLEPVDDEGVPAFANSGVLSQNQRIGILGGVVAIIAAVLWGIFAFAPGQLSLNEATETVELADRSNDFILDDDNGIVGSVLDLSTRDGTNELILDKGCQRLFGDDPKTVRWVNLAGEPMAEIRPAFPGNWRLHQACPMPSSTTVFATLLSDGVAISQVDPNGALVWTQVVNASNPNADTTQVMMDDQSVLLVAHDMADGAVHLVSFDEDGGENW